MNFYKKVLPRIAVSLGVLGAVAYTPGCSEDFLEVAPRGDLTPDILAGPDGINQLLIGTYANLHGLDGGFYSGSSNWLHGSVRGGDALKGSTAGDQAEANPILRYEINPTNSIVAGKWRVTFDGVARANLTLQTLQNSTDASITDEFRDNVTGQALFLRSHYYFELAKNFRNVPYITEDVTFEGVGGVANGPILEAIRDDLKRAVDLLPATQDAVGKANSWAAKAYLGKLHMYLGEWDEAKDILDDVIENGTNPAGLEFELLDNYSNNFNAEFDNGAESVFAVQAAVNTGTINLANAELVLNFPNGSGAPGGCCGFFQPSFDLVFSFRTNDDGLPLLDDSYRNSDNQIVNDFEIEAEADAPEDEGNIDPRLDYSVGRRGIPYLDWGDHPGRSWIREVTNGGPFAPKKFVPYQSQIGSLTDGSSWTSGYTAINYNIIRFSDVLLLAAEAHIESSSGDLDRATELINRVRSRAANSDAFITNDDGTVAANYVIGLYPDGLDQSALRAGVRFERKLELSGEGHRLYDLVRWGVAAEEINEYLDFERGFLPGPLAGAEFNANRDEYYPIPQTQIDLSAGVLTQNPGY